MNFTLYHKDYRCLNRGISEFPHASAEKQSSRRKSAFLSFYRKSSCSSGTPNRRIATALRSPFSFL